MFVMEYDTDYGESGEIELYAETEEEALEEADRLAEERPDIDGYSVDER